jgi:hypothetical protein
MYTNVNVNIAVWLIVYARLVAPEDDPLRLKHVVLDITIKIVALTVKLYMVIVYTQQDANFKKI